MNKKIVFLVEDDKDDVGFSIRAFKKNKSLLKYIIMAYDGIQAEKFLFSEDETELKKIQNMPDLIILDLKLPFLGGLEILKKIRERKYTRNIPVVVFTSSDDPEDLKNSYLLGANSFVKKPEDYEEYIETLKKVVDYWLEINMTLSHDRTI
ncbi:response regulator [bacterium]|nr:response regulator [bacterium]